MGKWNEFGPGAEALYIGGSKLEEIADVTGVSVTTLSGWKKKYRWAKKRKLSRKTAASIQEIVNQRLHEQLKGTSGVLNSKEADALYKLAKTQEIVGGVDDFAAQSILVLGEFQKFISSSVTDEMKQNVGYELIQAFFSHIQEKAF